MLRGFVVVVQPRRLTVSNCNRERLLPRESPRRDPDRTERSMSDLSDPLISNDGKKPTERAALRYGLGKADHERG